MLFLTSFFFFLQYSITLDSAQSIDSRQDWLKSPTSPPNSKWSNTQEHLTVYSRNQVQLISHQQSASQVWLTSSVQSTRQSTERSEIQMINRHPNGTGHQPTPRRDRQSNRVLQQGT